MIPLLQTKTADTAHTGIFASNRPLSRFLGGAWGRGYALVSRASHIFLYFRWEEREGEKNTSGHSGQLPVPRRNVIIAAGHAHGMQIKTFIRLYVTVL